MLQIVQTRRIPVRIHTKFMLIARNLPYNGNMKIRFLSILLCLLLLGCSIAPVRLSGVQPEPEDVSTEVVFVQLTPVPTACPTPEPSPTPTPSPTPSPTPTPTPTPSPTPTPEPTPDPNRRMVALTFDDGPNEVYTPQVLDLLEQYGVKGTFFVVGTHFNERTKPILQRMVDLGCEIGVHDTNHTNLTKLSIASVTKRMTQMREKISAQIDGGYETHLMRPPYGSTNKNVRKACKAAELASIRWSVDTMDWSNKSKKKIVRTVKSEVKNGSIVLFHDRLDATVEALKELIPWLLEQGYDLVTVTELIESSGKPVEYGRDYRYKPVK